MLRLILNILFMIIYWLYLTSPVYSGCAYEPNICAWDAWSQWSSCSLTCGPGIQTRSRDYCCMIKHELDVCLLQCNQTEDFFKKGSLETNMCVSAYNACTFKEYKNTGINITDFKEIYYDVINTSNNNYTTIHKLMNSPVLIHCSIQYCKHTCLHAYRHNLFCWGYTFKEPDTCLLYFCTGPLSVLYNHVQGTSIGESLYLRVCNNICTLPHNISTVTHSAGTENDTPTTPDTGIGPVLNTSLSSSAVSYQLQQCYAVSILLVVLAGFKL